MANVTANVNQLNVTVNSSPNNITVTDSDTGITLSNISTFVANVTVSSSTTEVNVAPLTAVSNVAIRRALSVDDTGGDGSLSYNNETGVFTYTGPSASEVRAHFSNVAPILYDSVTGVISIDEDAVFSGKTTDDLAQGNTNIYFSTTGATVNTDALPEGSTNLYLNGAGTTDDLTEGNTNLYFSNIRAREAVFQSTGPKPDFLTYGPGIEILSNGSSASWFLTANTSLIPEGANLYYTTDRANAAMDDYLTGGYGITYTGGTIFVTNTEIQAQANIAISENTTDNLSEGATNLYYTTDRANSAIETKLTDGTFTSNMVVNADLLVSGNLDITGNINYNEVTDLLVQDQTITLNYGNASVWTESGIIIDRGSRAPLGNVQLMWNETFDRWEFRGVDPTTGNTFRTWPIPRSTDDLEEGATNVYFTGARVDDYISTNTINTPTVYADAFIGPQSVSADYPHILGNANVWINAESSGYARFFRQDYFGVDTYVNQITDAGILTYEKYEKTVNLEENYAGSAVVFEINDAQGEHRFQYNVGTPQLDMNNQSGFLSYYLNGNSGNGHLVVDGNVRTNQSMYVKDSLFVNNSITLDADGGGGDINGLYIGKDTDTLFLTSAVSDQSNGEIIFSANITPGDNGDMGYLTANGAYGVSTDGWYIRESGTWQPVLTGTSSANVISVNGYTGVVVLDTDDIPEGSANLYYTDARVDAHLASGTGPLVVDGTTTLNGNTLITGNTVTLGNATVSTDLYTNGSINLDSSGADINMDFGVINMVNVAPTANAISTTGIIATSSNVTGQWFVGNLDGDVVGNVTGTVSSLANHDTDDLAEGATNKYYSSTLFNADFATKTTSDLAEGANLYYTDARVDSHLNTSTANVNQVLSWTGADYDWVDQTGGAGTYGDANVALFLSTNFGSNSIVTTGNITANTVTANTFSGGTFVGNITLQDWPESAYEVKGDIDGAVRFTVQAGEDLSKGNVVYISGALGDNTVVSKADASDPDKMAAFGLMLSDTASGAQGQVVTFGNLYGSGSAPLDTSGFSLGDTLYVSTTPGVLANVPPTGENTLIQNIGRVVRVQANNGVIKVGGAGRTNAVPNLDTGAIFAGSSTNQAVAVDTTSNFEVSDTTFDLSNTLTDINTVSAESGIDFTVNTNGNMIVKQPFGGAQTLSNSAVIAGDGYAFLNNNLYTNKLSYSGANALVSYKFDGNITAGSPDIVVSNITEYFSGNAASVSDIVQYMSYSYTGTFGGSQQGFPINAYVQSVDAGNSTITMSENAQATLSVTNAGFFPALIDTTRSQVVRILSEYDVSGGSNTAINNTGIINPDAFGYADTGFTMSDFDGIATGTSGDYSWDSSIADFFVGKTAFTPEGTFTKFTNGLVVGENTNLTNRAENDSLESFGINVMWDGVSSAGHTGKIPQILMKSYTDNTLAASDNAVSFSNKSLAGPRLLFTSSAGNANDYDFDKYPRVNQELGRISWWGQNGELTTPTSTYPPALISVLPHNDWTTQGDSALDPAGNADMYFAATTNLREGADVFMSYQGGKLTLASGKRADEDRSGIYFAPAQQNRLLTEKGIGETYIEGNTHVWAKIGPANVSADTGSQLTVTNGGGRGNVVGDIKMSLKRESDANVEFSIYSVFDAALAGQTFGTIAAAIPVEAYDTISQYGFFTVSGTFVESPNGNENGLVGNTYRAIKAAKVSDNSYGIILLYTAGYSAVTYTSIGGSPTYPAFNNAPQNQYHDRPLMSFANSQSYTAKEWTFDLENASDNLKLKVDDVTVVEYTSTNVSVTGDVIATGNVDCAAVNTNAVLVAGDVSAQNVDASQNVSAIYGVFDSVWIGSGANTLRYPATDGGTNGQVLALNTATTPNSLEFVSAGTGSVTSIDVAGGAGLTSTGGPITSSGTITLDIGAGTGITVNADNVAVNMSAFSTSDLVEGANLYFTDARAVSAVEGSSTLSLTGANVQLKQFQETVATTATTTGTVNLNTQTLGSIFKLTPTGNCTLAASNWQAGTSLTVIITHAGGYTISVPAAWKWAGGNKTFSTTPGDIDIISIFYDGSQAYASLTTGYV